MSVTVGDAITIFKGIWTYSESVRSAPEEIQGIETELQRIKAGLKIADETRLDDSRVRQARDNILTETYKSLGELQAKLNKHRMLRRYLWFFKKGDADRRLDSIRSDLDGLSNLLGIQVVNTTFSTQVLTVTNLLPHEKEATINSQLWRSKSACAPKTREGVVSSIRQWAGDKDSKPLFWLSGVAGSGKSTVSLSAARRLVDAGHLVATYFFEQETSQPHEPSKLVTTLARELMACHPELTSIIGKAIIENRALLDAHLGAQWDNLIIGPLREIHRGNPTASPTVIVIDGLDRCTNDDKSYLTAILGMLKMLSQLHGNLRILLSSRPRCEIQEALTEMGAEAYQALCLDDVDEADATGDIEEFIKAKLKPIVETEIPQSDLTRLLSAAEGNFAYAAAICGFIEDESRLMLDGSPQDHLQRICRQATQLPSSLDQLYRSALRAYSEAFTPAGRADRTHEGMEFFGRLVLTYEALPVSSHARMADLTESKLRRNLASFRSILLVPGEDKSQKPIRALHSSFRDFLVHLDPADSFAIDVKSTHRVLARRCLEMMQLALHKDDLCDLGLSETSLASVPPKLVEERILPESRYACRYWIDHLLESGDLSDSRLPEHEQTYTDVLEFMETYFLRWLEACCLTRVLDKILGPLAKLEMRLPTSPDGDCPLRTLLAEALSFANAGVGSKIEQYPLKIYALLLPSAPANNRIRVLFSASISERICGPSPGDSPGWSPQREPQAGSIVAVTACGGARASMTEQGFVTLKDSAGCRTVEAHGPSPHGFLVFNEVNLHLVSASHDSPRIRVWDRELKQVQQFADSTANVRAIACHPAGSFLASAHADLGYALGGRSITVWDLASGSVTARLQKVEPHYDVVGITFSPAQDSRILASMDEKGKVRLWNFDTGARLGHIILSLPNPHSVFGNSLRFHGDNVVLTSSAPSAGLGACPVQAWDARSGMRVEDPVAFRLNVLCKERGAAMCLLAPKATLLWEPETGQLCVVRPDATGVLGTAERLNVRLPSVGRFCFTTQGEATHFFNVSDEQHEICSWYTSADSDLQ